MRCNVLDCVGFSLKEDQLQNVSGSGLLTDWSWTDGRTDGRIVSNFGRKDSQGPRGPLRENWAARGFQCPKDHEIYRSSAIKSGGNEKQSPSSLREFAWKLLCPLRLLVETVLDM